MPTLQSLEAFVDRLQAHDWWYDYSDDQRVWRQGFNEWNSLSTMANGVPMYAKILTAYAQHRNNYGNVDLHRAFLDAVSDAVIEIQGAEHIQQDEHTY